MPAQDAVPGRLNSWKEIAGYLDRQVRSVQRWEKEEGLPVHRLPHKKQSSVYAFTAELDAWRERRPGLEEPPPGPPPSPPTAPARSGRGVAVAGLAVLALAVAAGGWWRYRRQAPAPAPAPTTVAWGRLFARATSQGAQPRLIPLGPEPSRAAITPDGATIFVSDTADGSVSVINAAAERLEAKYRLGGAPSSLNVAPDGQRLYVGDSAADRVSIIDIRTGAKQVIATAGPVSDAVLTRDGRQLYLALQYAGLERLDTRTLALTPLTSPACPAFLSLGPSDHRLFIAYQCGGLGGRSGHDAIGILDLASENFVGRLAGPPQVGSAIAISPDGAELWASVGDACTAPQYDHRGCGPASDDSVNIFSLGEGRLIRTLYLPGQAVRHIAFLPDTARALIGGDSLSVVDTARLAVLERLPNVIAGGVAVAPDRRRAYVPLAARHALAVFDASPAGCAPPAANLLGWWPGDGSADDAWGVENGHLAGAVGYASGRVGQAFAFAGRPGAVAFGHDRHLQPAVSFGVAAWVQLAPVAAPVTLFAKMSGLGPHRHGWQLRQLADGRLSLCLGGGDRDGCSDARTTLTTPAPVADGTWHHIALAVGRDSLLYLDGKPVARNRLDLSHSAAAETAFRVGDADPGAPRLRGLVDEVVLYGETMPAATVRALVNMPACLGIGR